MLGEFGGACESDRVLRLRNILQTSGVEVPVPEEGNIKRELWRKATMMCCMGPMSAVTRADIHTMLNTPASRAMLLAAMEEVCALSACFEGCYVGDGWALQTMTYLEKIKPGSTPSTVRDVVCGRPSEVREMSGAMHRLGLQQVRHCHASSRHPFTPPCFFLPLPHLPLPAPALPRPEDAVIIPTYVHLLQKVATPVHTFISAALEPQEARARGEATYTLDGVPGGKPSVV